MNVLIVGATGYAGQQLTTLLTYHPEVSHLYLASGRQADRPFETIYPHTSRRVQQTLCDSQLVLTPAFLEEKQIGVCFLALPHGESTTILPKLIHSKTIFIDLGADFRLKNPELYEKWHGTPPANPYLEGATYGLCEWHRSELKTAKFIANPGCYATATLLATLPVIKQDFLEDALLFVDGKSGISGSGRQATLPNLYGEATENVRPYKTGTHQHTPEIEENLSHFSGLKKPYKVLFAPSVVPMTRGLISTAYFKLKAEVCRADIQAAYQKAYSDEPFIRLTDAPPATKYVRGSNYADVWYHLDERTQTLTAMCAIDNLIKGAAGQAVQNMNLRFGLCETLGIDLTPLYP